MDISDRLKCCHCESPLEYTLSSISRPGDSPLHQSTDMQLPVTSSPVHSVLWCMYFEHIDRGWGCIVLL